MIKKNHSNNNSSFTLFLSRVCVCVYLPLSLGVGYWTVNTLAFIFINFRKWSLNRLQFNRLHTTHVNSCTLIVCTNIVYVSNLSRIARLIWNFQWSYRHRYRCGWQHTHCRHKETERHETHLEIRQTEDSARLSSTDWLTDGIKKSMRTLSTLPYHFAQHNDDTVCMCCSCALTLSLLRRLVITSAACQCFATSTFHIHILSTMAYTPTSIQHANVKSVVPFCCSTQ